MYNTDGNGLRGSVRGITERRDVKMQAFASPWS